MTSYPTYKPTATPWLPAIPKHWGLQSFRRVTWEINRKNDDGQTRPMLSLSAYRGIETKEWEYAEQARLQEDSLAYKIVAPDQLVINPMWCINGAVAVSQLDGIVSPAYRVYRLRSALRPRFADYLFRSHFYIKEYNLHVRGSTTYDRSVGKEAFNRLPVVLPPAQEQDTIVAFLEAKERDIQAFIANKRRTIHLLKEQKTALINRAVTRGLNPNAPPKPSGIPWLDEIPNHWVRVKITWVCSSIRDGTHNPPPEADGPYRLLSVRNIIDGEFVVRDDDRRMTEASFRELQRSYTVQEGDVVLAIVGGTTGKSAVVRHMENVTVQRSLAVLRPTKRRVLPEFLNLCLQLPCTQRAIWLTADKYSAQPGIYLTDVSRLRIPLPPLDEQVEILKLCSTAAENVLQATSAAEREIQLMQEYRTAIIAAAVTGKIDVSSTSQSLLRGAHLPSADKAATP